MIKIVPAKVMHLSFRFIIADGPTHHKASDIYYWFQPGPNQVLCYVFLEF